MKIVNFGAMTRVHKAEAGSLSIREPFHCSAYSFKNAFIEFGDDTELKSVSCQVSIVDARENETDTPSATYLSILYIITLGIRREYIWTF